VKQQFSLVKGGEYNHPACIACGEAKPKQLRQLRTVSSARPWPRASHHDRHLKNVAMQTSSPSIDLLKQALLIEIPDSVFLKVCLKCVRAMNKVGILFHVILNVLLT
jgi:hypothetical protein